MKNKSSFICVQSLLNKILMCLHDIKVLQKCFANMLFIKFVLEILIKDNFSLETNFLIVLAALYVHILLIRQHTSVRVIMVFGIPSLSHPVWGDTMGLKMLDLN